jgi:hypothetical protein
MGSPQTIWFGWILNDLLGNPRLETLDDLAQAIYGLE